MNTLILIVHISVLDRYKLQDLIRDTAFLCISEEVCK